MDIASRTEFHFEQGIDQQTGEQWVYTRKITAFVDKSTGTPFQREYFAQPIDLLGTDDYVLFDLFDDSGNKIGDDLRRDQLGERAEEHFREYAERVAEGSEVWA